MTRAAVVIVLSFAAVATMPTVVCAQQEVRKLAFLVGVSKYQKDGLRNLNFAEDDIRDLALELRKHGFETSGLLGDRATLKGIQAELDTFYAELKKLNKDDVVLLAFSGHGLQLQVPRDGRVIEEPFYCPVDALKTDPQTLLSLNDIFARIEQDSGSSQNVLLIDACRDNPAKGTKGVDGSTAEKLPNKISILFSSSAGTQSFESDQVRHGIFTHFVLECLRGQAADRRGQITWLTLASYVMESVAAETPKLLDNAALNQRPNLLGNLVRQPVLVTPPSPDALPRVYKSKSTNLEMVLIDAGEFQMGSPTTVTDRRDDEFQHSVRITKPFYLGKYQVTQSDYQRVMGNNPSYFASSGSGKDSVTGLDTSRFPVEYVSWYDAAEFCNKLSQQDGFVAYYTLGNVQRESNTIKSATVTIAGGNGYRLPTEAEWEYACRAGTTTPFHFGATNNGREANVDGNNPYGTSTKGPYLQRTTTVGNYAPNRFGLYDMHGNVWEWCWDWYDKDYYAGSPTDDPKGSANREYRVLRGGSWLGSAWLARSALRFWNAPVNRVSLVGFRVSRTP